MELRELKSIPFQYSETLKLLLRQGGFRLTNQRKKILEIFNNAPSGYHISAEEIYQNLSRKDRIGISTIYRMLHLMVDLGLLRELDLSEDRKYYELNMPFVNHHHHLVCTQCGFVEEFEEDLITKVGMKEAQSRDFLLLDCQFTVHAICPRCQDSQNEQRKT
ncbi:MAG: Fur family transcriptional regulator [Elainellaceae cyanobacterium]